VISAWSGLSESNRHLNLGKVSVNFKNAGNGSLFNVFEVPQMENGRWKMEDGKWKMDSSSLGIARSRGEVRP